MINKNNILLINKTKERSANHRFALIWKVRCEHGHEFDCNSCDFHERKCPFCN